MVPWEKPTRARRSSLRPWRASSSSMKAVEHRRGQARAGQDRLRLPVLQAEPLPAERRHVAGKRRVRRDEGGAGQEPRQLGRQADEVVAIGAQAVQQDDQRARRPARRRVVTRAVQVECRLGHGVPPSLARLAVIDQPAGYRKAGRWTMAALGQRGVPSLVPRP